MGKRLSGANCETRNYSTIIELAIISAVMLFGAFLRFRISLSEPVNPDELGNIVCALKGPWAYLTDIYEIKYNPPFFLLILSIVLRAGGTIRIIRIIFTILAVATIPASFLTARKFFNAKAGMILASLIAVNPLMITNNYQMRGASMGCLFTVLSMYFLYDALERGKSHYLFLAASTLAIYSHYFLFVPFLVTGIYLFIKKARFPKLCIDIATWIFMPAVILVLSGIYHRRSDIIISSTLQQRATELGAAFFHNFTGQEQVFQATLFFGLLIFSFRRFSFFSFVWLSSALLCLLIICFFRIHNYYLCPIFIFGWTQLSSLVAQDLSPSRIVVVYGLILFLLFNIATNAVHIIPTKHTLLESDTYEIVSAVKKSGLHDVFIDSEINISAFYGASKNDYTMLSMTKTMLQDDYVQWPAESLHGMANHDLSINFLSLLSIEHLQGYLKKNGPAVVVQSTSRKNILDLTSCTNLLSNQNFQSYICRESDI